MSSRVVNVYRDRTGDLSAYAGVHTDKFQDFGSGKP